MSVKIDFGEVYTLNVKMRKFTSIFRETERLAIGQSSDMLLERIKALAPVRTGAYRDSWYKTTILGGFKLQTDSPYAARLEYGFVGTDSMGRNYAQSAQPHVRPAMEAVLPLFKRLYGEAVEKAWA